MKNTQRGFIAPLLISVIAVLVVGGGVYVYQQNTTSKNDLNKNVGNQVSTTTSVAEKTVSSNSQIAVSGKYYVFEGNMFGEPVCFDVDANSASMIPRPKNDTRKPWFCFSNQAEAKKALGIDSIALKGQGNCELRGNAKLNISNYVVFTKEAAGYDTAKLEKVISFDKPVPTNCNNSSSIQPSITVLSPNGGGFLEQNTSYSVTWKYTGLSENDSITIGLRTLNENVCWVGKTTASKKSYSFVPSQVKCSGNIIDLKSGGQFKVQLIVEKYADGRGVADMSDNYFTINKIADWKVYENAQYGFEIKHPSDWIVKERKISIGTGIDLSKDDYELTISASKLNWIGEGIVSEQDATKAYMFLSPIVGKKVWRDIVPHLPEEPISGIYGFDVSFPEINTGSNSNVYKYYRYFNIKNADTTYSFSYYLPKGITNVNYDKKIISQIDQILSTFKFTSVVSQPSLPTTCTDQQESVPVITSLSSNSGPVGTKLVIGGCNFAGFESDLNVWVENAQGVKGILYSEIGSTAKSMSVILKPQACQTDESYRGLPCASYLNLIPGTYKIYTIPWGKKSNEVLFTIK